jgi:hypothetical protein
MTTNPIEDFLLGNVLESLLGKLLAAPLSFAPETFVSLVENLNRWLYQS